MFCIQCGTRLPNGAAFCQSCGARAVEPATEASAESVEGFVPVFRPARSLDAQVASNSSTNETNELSAAAYPMSQGAHRAEGEPFWVRYRQAFLWPTADERIQQEIGVLAKGTRVEVLERARAGKVRVLVEDGMAGWLDDVVLSRTPVGRDAPVTAAASAVNASRPYAQSTGSDVGILGRLLFLGGGIGMVASPFLPWIGASFIISVNLSLYDAAKMFDDYSGFAEVLTIGIVAVVGGLLRVTRIVNLTVGRVWAVLAGGAGLVEVIYRYTKFQDSFGSGFGFASLQFGFYLLGGASVAVLVSVFLDREQT